MVFGVEIWCNRCKQCNYSSRCPGATSRYRYYSVPTAGPRKMAAKNDNKQWLMTGRGKMNYMTATEGVNMWNEPVMAFAVKRVRDEGKRFHQFEDGTKIVKADYIRFDDIIFTGERYNYAGYKQAFTSAYWKDTFFFNGEPDHNLDLQVPIE